MKNASFVLVAFLFLISNTTIFSQDSNTKEKAKKTICSFWDEYQIDINAQVKATEKDFIRKKLGKAAALDFEAYDNIEQWLNTQTKIALNSKVISIQDLEENAERKALKYGYQNRKMLEKFKANEISSYFGGVSNLAVQEFYASYNSGTKEIAIGKNSSLLGKEQLNRFDWILNTGLTIKTDNEFGTIVEEGALQRENLTLNLSISKLAKGYVNFRYDEANDPNYLGIMVDHRENNLKAKMMAKVDDYILNGFERATDSLQRIHAKYHNPNGDYSKAMDAYAKGRRNKYYSETAGEEIKFLKGNSLYKSFETHWFTFNFNLPLGNQTYANAASADNTTVEERNFNAWNASASVNYLWKKPKGASYIVNSSLGIKNNNNFLAGSASQLSFQTIQEQGENQQAILASQTVFVGDYKEFVTVSGKIDLASLFINEAAGLRLAYEKNFGDFDDSIFLAGIPLIVKEKGKPVVNLEFQYRRVNDTNLWGLSTSLLLASLIK